MEKGLKRQGLGLTHLEEMFASSVSDKCRWWIRSFCWQECSSMSVLFEEGRKVEHPTPCNCPSSDVVSQHIQNKLAFKEQEVAT
ncbi:hypothetical protein GOBAR_DD02168 [Gossypium barbadense]|nr:hypothetical protein GOBAR_DD02168 [Gossypium barbadense]